jgi:hypothetical protein
MKGTNLRIQELRESLANVINEAKLPVAVTSMVLADMLGGLKDAESKMIQLEKQAYEKELAEKEGAKDVEVIH